MHLWRILNLPSVSLQVRLRPAHLQGLRRVPGGLPVHTVHAGHRHGRLPASAPHRRQRGELQSVNQVSKEGMKASGSAEGFPHPSKGRWGRLRHVVLSLLLRFAFDWFFFISYVGSPADDLLFSPLWRCFWMFWIMGTLKRGRAGLSLSLVVDTGI